jgi:hypothetical protein
MTPVLDGGGILTQQVVDVPPGASVLEATARLFDTGAALLTAKIGQLRPGDSGAPQKTAGSYQSWPSSREVRALRAMGTPLMRLGDLGPAALCR